MTSPRGSIRASERLPVQLAYIDSSISAFFGRSLFARPVLDDLDDARQILLCAALKDAVIQDEPQCVAHPHRHAELLALCDGEIDVLREYLDSCAKVAEPSDSVSRYTVTACGSLRNGGFLAHRGR